MYLYVLAPIVVTLYFVYWIFKTIYNLTSLLIYWIKRFVYRNRKDEEDALRSSG